MCSSCGYHIPIRFKMQEQGKQTTETPPFRQAKTAHINQSRKGRHAAAATLGCMACLPFGIPCLFEVLPHVAAFSLTSHDFRMARLLHTILLRTMELLSSHQAATPNQRTRVLIRSVKNSYFPCGSRFPYMWITSFPSSVEQCFEISTSLSHVPSLVCSG